ncbi:MAG TPA: polyphosphate kinase 1 [Acidimicrobiales bacterium]|nr:polyphosphate kinase 1 [Acidimicrobiales bacterium]
MRDDVAVTAADDTADERPEPDARYLSRQLSELDFNDRLLDLAEDPSMPLLERVKFLALFSERIDEFFQVQVSGLKRQMSAGLLSLSLEGRSPSQQLRAIRGRLSAMVARQAAIYTGEIVPGLAKAGISVLDWASLDDGERRHLTQLFDEEILPILTPLAVDPRHPFPYISDGSLSVGTIVRDPDDNDARFARVKVPPILPRLIRLLEGQRFIFLEDVIAANLTGLFPGMVIGDPCFFRVTRDADMAVDEDEAENILSAVREDLRQRRFLPVVRLEIESRATPEIVDMLLAELGIDGDDLYRIDGRLGLDGLWSLHGLDRPDLLDEPWVPVTRPPLASHGDDPVDQFSILSRHDVFVHHPYDSFTTSVEAFVNEAADDADVLAIKQTLYRTSGDSSIVAALTRAAERGKQVVVLVELTARFDEQANIEWARVLEEAGAHVVYGLVGLKTHSKTTLVVRREGQSIRRYCHVGTGNYNPKTAKLYEDLGILSARQELGNDLTDFFNSLTGLSHPPEYHDLILSPGGIKERVLAEIRDEALAGPDGRIVIKCNGLDDQVVIDALYEAAAAAVPIDLIVRGICCLRPQVPGLSETVRVRSIVGRFLEHSRIFRFGGDGRPARFFIGSADLRRRNLDRRVEAMIPVRDEEARRQLNEILDINLADDVQAWGLGADGEWSRIPTVKGLATQQRLMDLAKERAAAAEVPRSARPSTWGWFTSRRRRPR